MFVKPAPLGHRIDDYGFPCPFLDDVRNDGLDRNSCGSTKDARDDQGCELPHINAAARGLHEAAGRAAHGVGSTTVRRIQVVIINVRVPLHAFCHLRERDAFSRGRRRLRSYRNGRVGVRRRDNVPLRRGTAAGHLGRSATRRRAVTRPKLWGSPRRRSKAARAAYGTGQPLDTITSYPNYQNQTGQPQSASWANTQGTVLPIDETAHSLGKKAQNPFPDR